MKKPILLILCATLYLSSHAQNNDSLKKPRSVDTLHLVIKEPEFPGGKDALYRFIANNCHYPATSREENKQGDELVKILIEKDGHPSSITVIESVSYAIDQEIARVMSLSPRWIPASKNGTPIQGTYNIRITFAIEGSSSSIFIH
jgi:TonB family protein